MITEDYVPFEIAKLLKEKGFDEDICLWYDENGDIFFQQKYEMIHNWRVKQGLKVYYQCPTLQTAIKWLRKVYHWYIFVVPRWKDDEYIPEELEEKIIGYQYVIVPIGKVNKKNEQPIITVPTPESAYEEAIKYCIENLV